MNPTCDLCGREMVPGTKWVRDEKWGRGREVETGEWECEATAEQHQIAQLERENAVFKATAQGLLEFQGQDREKIADLEHQIQDVKAENAILSRYRLSLSDAIAERDEARSQLDEAKAEATDADSTATRMRQILTETANALKGEPEELKQHSWHDLPKLVLELEARERLAWTEAHEALTKLRASEERELALRHRLASDAVFTHNGEEVCTRCGWSAGLNAHEDGCSVGDALRNTSATAQQTVERIEKETREEVWSAVKDMWGASPMQFRAAILGEKP